MHMKKILKSVRQFRRSVVKKINSQSSAALFLAATIFSTLLGSVVLPAIAVAGGSDPTSSYLITGVVSLSGGVNVSLSGTATGNPQQGSDGNQKLAVDWDLDKNASTTSWLSNTDVGGPVFSPAFSDCYNHSRCFVDNHWTATHNYLRSEEHTSELQSPDHLVCRLLLEKK